MAETEAPPNSPPKEEKVKKVLRNGVTGTVKWFSLYSGYGFINRDDDNTDVFVHHSSISEKNPGNHFSSLGENEKVIFDVVQGDKGLEAASVTGPDGSAVQGHKSGGRRFPGRGRGKGRGGGSRGPRVTSTDSPKENENDQNTSSTGGASPKKKVEIPKGEKVASAVTGKIKWFAARKGYGFVSRDDNEEDVFVHHTSFAKQTTNNFRPAIRENDALLFDVMKGEKGFLADNVTKPDGEPVENLKFGVRRTRKSSRGRGRGVSGGSRKISENDQHETDTEQDEKPIKEENSPARGGGRRGGRAMRRPYRGGRGDGGYGPPGGYEEESYGYGYRQPRFYPNEPRMRGGRGNFGYNSGYFPAPRYYDNGYGPGPMMRGGPRGRGRGGRPLDE